MNETEEFLAKECPRLRANIATLDEQIVSLERVLDAAKKRRAGSQELLDLWLDLEEKQIVIDSARATAGKETE